jgi:creatinine amidohydrolase/Fe(II)-dependent formamide hydrolase-like protein
MRAAPRRQGTAAGVERRAERRMGHAGTQVGRVHGSGLGPARVPSAIFLAPRQWAVVNAPLHLKALIPGDVGRALERDPRLLVPVGTCEQHGPHLPLGCDTLIVERLADDLSAAFQILRAPTVEYGVNTLTRRPRPGDATVRRKTLHRWMNDLIGSWEQAGVDAFIILTAHGYDPHQEALSTLRTRHARVLTVDVFALDFSDQIDDSDPFGGSELDTSLLLYLAPDLVQMSEVDGVVAADPSAQLASGAKGERLYRMIYERIASQVVDSAA